MATKDDDPEDGYRGWARPGPVPPGGLSPGDGETLDYLCGRFRIFQYERGHRYSTDDLLTAWYGCLAAPSAGRVLDLGSGIGSVAMATAFRLRGARFVTVEAQEMSLRLARKSLAYNGLEERFEARLGDFRDPAVLAGVEPFDLVLGSPPYFPAGTVLPARHAQAVPARIEVRGDLADYAATAARHLAAGGVFACVFVAARRAWAEERLAGAGLFVFRQRDVVFREGEGPRLTLFAATRAGDLPPSHAPFVEPPLVVRRPDGSHPPEYSALRLSIGLPPGNQAGAGATSSACTRSPSS